MNKPTPEELKKMTFAQKSEYLKKSAEASGIGWKGNIFPDNANTIISATIAQTLPDVEPEPKNPEENEREN
jgi:hypothetical protein